MKITKVEVQKNNKEKVNVFVDDKYSFSVTFNGLIEYGISKGDEITDEEIEEIKRKDSPALAVMQAANIISYAQRTEKELERKLRDKKFNDDAIEYAINKMKGYGYIDDDAYVTSFISSKAIPNHWGEQKIISSLLQKGISIELIKEKIEECFSDDIRLESATEAAKKYLPKIEKYDERKKQQKLYQHLISKGFKYDIVSQVCKKVIKAVDSYYDSYG